MIPGGVHDTVSHLERLPLSIIHCLTSLLDADSTRALRASSTLLRASVSGTVNTVHLHAASQQTHTQAGAAWDVLALTQKATAAFPAACSVKIQLPQHMQHVFIPAPAAPRVHADSASMRPELIDALTSSLQAGFHNLTRLEIISHPWEPLAITPLQRLHQLQALDLSRCHLHLTDLAAIAPQLTALTELRLPLPFLPLAPSQLHQAPPGPAHPSAAMGPGAPGPQVQLTDLLVFPRGGVGAGCVGRYDPRSAFEAPGQRMQHALSDAQLLQRTAAPAALGGTLAALQQLQTLQLGLFPGMCDAHLGAVASLGGRLRSLELWLAHPLQGHGFSPSGLAQLSRLTRLEKLTSPGFLWSRHSASDQHVARPLQPWLEAWRAVLGPMLGRRSLRQLELHDEQLVSGHVQLIAQLLEEAASRSGHGPSCRHGAGAASLLREDARARLLPGGQVHESVLDSLALHVTQAGPFKPPPASNAAPVAAPQGGGAVDLTMGWQPMPQGPACRGLSLVSHFTLTTRTVAFVEGLWPLLEAAGISKPGLVPVATSSCRFKSREVQRVAARKPCDAFVFGPGLLHGPWMLCSCLRGNGHDGGR